MKFRYLIVIIFCLFLGLLGCSNELEQAKRNADAGMSLYEESQSLEGYDAVRAGLKWLFSILKDTELPEKQMDSVLLEKRNKVILLLTDKYLMSKEQIEKISSIKDDETRDQKIDAIHLMVTNNMVEKQKAEQEEQKKQLTDSNPQIGMTQQEVLASKWGKPKEINTTETKYGKSEQWVYGNNRYVYFDDGIVTSIQY